MRFIRFDKGANRSQRIITNNFALASEIWNPFIENCIKYFKHGMNMAIDAQLFSIEEKCRFLQ